MCHLILLMPFFGLPVFWLWPLSLALPLYLVILLLSVWVYYYYTFAAMRRKVSIGPETLLHSRGEEAAIGGPTTSARIQGELWSARSKKDLDLGDAIEVTDVDGLTLRVCRLGQAGSDALA